MALLERNDTGAVTHIRMTSPGNLNALSDAMIAALQDMLDLIAKDSSVRAIVLSGEGKAFCAGHDLKEMTAGRAAPDGGAEYFADLFQRCGRLMQTVQKVPQPVIAAPHGIATAAGCQLVASCDLAVAAEGTRFGVNGVNIGLFCSTPMVALSRNIPRKQAFRMLTTGDFIDCATAEAYGLINESVPAENHLNAAMELALKIAGKLGSAVRVGKEAFYRQVEMPVAEAYEYTGGVMVQNMLHTDTAEGIAAFLEKRHPEWSQ